MKKQEAVSGSSHIFVAMGKKRVTVFGATGQQGGSVARALLKDPEFAVRAVARNPSSQAAIKLQQQGAEVCQGDMDKKETLGAVLKDAHACFIVTNVGPKEGQKEIDQGEAVVEACKQAKVKHIVYSSLESCIDLANIPVQQYDAKAVVEDKIKESNIPFTNVRAGAFHENFLSSMINRAQGNTFGLALPMGDKPLYLMHIDGIGECVRTILKNPSIYKNKTLGLATDNLTADQIVEILNKHFASKKNFINFGITPDAFEQMGFPGADEVANMFRFHQTGKCERDIALTQKLNPNILSFDEWVSKNKDTIDANLNKQPHDGQDKTQ